MVKTILLLVLLAAPFAVYFLLLRPRLKMKYTEFYAEIDGFWARQWARIVALRSFFIGSAGALATAVPLLLELFLGIDFSFLPEPWPGYVAAATSIVLTLNRVLSTLPGNEKA